MAEFDGELQVRYTPATQPGEVTVVSVEDREAAEAARNQAQVARDVAVAASGVFTAPADSVIASLIEDRESAVSVALDTRVGSSVDLVSKMQAPLYLSHRGGYHVYPEHSMEAYRASAAAGFPIELDIAALSDGTLVCIHDATVTRTMDGVTGNVSSLTKAQWLNGRIKPAVLGGLRGTRKAVPVLFDEVLSEFGGKTVLLLEVKDGDPTITNAVISAVVERGLQRSVIMQSFTYSDCLQAVAAGIPALFASNIANPATLAADGVEFVSYNIAATNAYITSLNNAGIKPIMYTPATRAEALAEFARGAFAVFSDDPWGMTGRFPVETFEDFRDGNLWPLAGTISNPAGTTVPAVVLDPMIPGLSLTFNSVDLGASASVRLGQFGEGPTICKIRFTLQFLAGAAEQGRWVSLFVGSTVGDKPYNDELEPSTAQGYHVLMRRNGAKDLYKRVAGNASGVAIGTSVPSSTPHAPSASTNGVPIDFEFQVTATHVTLKNLTDGTVSTAADTSIRVNNAHIAFRASSNPVVLSNIRVSR